MEIGDIYIHNKYKHTIIGFEVLPKYGKIVQVERDDGIKCKLMPQMVEERLKACEKTKQTHKKKSYSIQFKGNVVFWEFIRYLAQHSRIGGFQSTAQGTSQLKRDYYNATGEELKEDQYNPDLSPETWGNAMRVYFPKPDNMSIEDLNHLLPGDVEAKKWNNDSNDLIISRMPFVLELLSVGFRHGKQHDIEKIEGTIEVYCPKKAKSSAG